jgi:hypothetical protein
VVLAAFGSQVNVTRVRSASPLPKPVHTATARVFTESDNAPNAPVSAVFTGVAAASAAAAISFSVAAQ